MHQLIYLSCDNNRFANPVAATNHHLLSKEHFLCWYFNAEVTPGNHDTITGFSNLIKIKHTLFTLNLKRRGGREKL